MKKEMFIFSYESDLCDLLAVSVEAPAADLVRSDDVLDEEDAVGEAQAEFVEQLDVLEDVLVGGPGVAVLVVVAVDQKLHDRLQGVGGDQGLGRGEKKVQSS